MSVTFDPQFHTRIAQQGQRSVWLPAPLPETLLPQKTALYLAWRANEGRRLQAGGDIVLHHGPSSHLQSISPTAERAEAAASYA